MKNTFGSDLSLTIFGESHGRAIGAVLDGMAAGLPVDETFLAACMDKRRARGDGLSTPRVEADAVQLLSGVVNGHTTGTAIALMIENQNTRSGDYAKTADLLRPGHADYTAYAKYHGFQDARGGGHFSGRVTAALVAGGSIVLAALQRAGIDITTHIARCADIADTPFALDDPAALAAHRDPSGVVPAAVLGQTLSEGFDRAPFPKLRTVDQNQPTLARRRRFIRLECHAFCLPLLWTVSGPFRQKTRRPRWRVPAPGRWWPGRPMPPRWR